MRSLPAELCLEQVAAWCTPADFEYLVSTFACRGNEMVETRRAAAGAGSELSEQEQSLDGMLAKLFRRNGSWKSVVLPDSDSRHGTIRRVSQRDYKAAKGSCAHDAQQLRYAVELLAPVESAMKALESHVEAAQKTCKKDLAHVPEVQEQALAAAEWRLAGIREVRAALAEWESLAAEYDQLAAGINPDRSRGSGPDFAPYYAVEAKMKSWEELVERLPETVEAAHRAADRTMGDYLPRNPRYR